jgi:hypothetical protein
VRARARARVRTRPCLKPAGNDPRRSFLHSLLFLSHPSIPPQSCPPPLYMLSVLPFFFPSSFLSNIHYFLLSSTGVSSLPSLPPRVPPNNHPTLVSPNVSTSSDQSLMALHKMLFTFVTSGMSSTLKVRSWIPSSLISQFQTI